MDNKQRNKKWSFLMERQFWCNILTLAIGFSLMVVYTKVTISRERDANVADNGNTQSLERDWIQRIREPEFLGAHLTAARGGNSRMPGSVRSIPRGDYFRWTSSGSNSFSSLEINEEQEGTMVYIHKPGFYFVYSQIRYNGNGNYPAGHITVKISQEMPTSLMTSVATQQLASTGTRQSAASQTLDSGYHAGVFYFAAGDKLGVKPLRSQRLATLEDDATFFGLYFLHN